MAPLERLAGATQRAFAIAGTTNQVIRVTISGMSECQNGIIRVSFPDCQIGGPVSGVELWIGAVRQSALRQSSV